MPSRFTVDKPPIPIVPNISTDQITHVTLYHTWTANDEVKKAKYEMPSCHVPDVELLLHVIHEFYDVTNNARLHLSTGTVRFTKFRECLRGTPRDRWDMTCAARTANNENMNSTDDFDNTIDQFLLRFVTDQCLQVQEEYLLTRYRKRYDDNIEELNDRLSKIKHLCCRFPSHNNITTPVFSEQKLKNFLFNMMLKPWQENFRGAGYNWGEAEWTRDRLVTYFNAQAQLMDQREEQRKRRRQQNNRQPYGW